MNTHKLVIDSRENSELFGFVEFEAHRLMISTEKKWLILSFFKPTKTTSCKLTAVGERRLFVS